MHVHSELQPIADAQLRINGGQMILDRLIADAKALSNFRVAAARGDQQRHMALPTSQIAESDHRRSFNATEYFMITRSLRHANGDGVEAARPESAAVREPREAYRLTSGTPSRFVGQLVTATWVAPHGELLSRA